MEDLLALLTGGFWVGLLYYCCYGLYAGFIALKLHEDMRDIAGFYLSSPDNCFWVTEAEINGRPQIMVHIVIRKFQPSDHDAVTAIFRDGIQEHIIPSFTHAISQPLHITVTLCFFTVGYILGGESVVLALLAGGFWIGLLYYCCYEFYAGFVRLKLNTDMRDIAGFYLSSPDNCFWVAEAEINGRPQIMGIVAVEAKELPDSGQKYGELFRMNVSSTSRRTGLGSRLGQTVMDFCKERGFSKIVLETSSTQTAAVALYYKMGFTLVRTHEQAEAPWWGLRLVGVTILRMEKILQPCEGM